MKRMLFNATQAEELRVAIVDGQTLLDLDIETLGKEQRKGNIYKGIITRIEPSLEACFVDYGTDRHGFLPFKEVSRSYFQDYEGGRARIQDVLREGMEVIVQVEKDERGNKGAALTTFISLAGRYLVLMPNNPRGGGISRRIEGEERQELKNALAELDVPRGMSLIARTAGIGRSVEELQWDFNYLLQLWRAIEEAGKAHHDPYLLFMESSLVIRAVRDYFRPDIGEILIDNQDVYEQVSEFMSYVMPNNVGRLKQYTDHTPLFSRFQIEHQIESAFSRSVSLPSGGAIVIDHTEALVSVDVNSARATRGADIEDTAFKTNMEAAEEVARQMRLRDLGGLVVIDFIDMENPKHQRDVETVLRDALRKDRARVQMGKLSRFGLLELSRQRLKPALGESSHVACPRCAGTGVIRSIESTALHVLRIIQEEAMKDNTGEVHAQVPVDVATFLLNEKRAELFGLEERLDVSVFLIPNIHLENPHYEINRVRNDDVDGDAAPSYQRVEVPEKEAALPMGMEKAKSARPEPAVKGVKHTQPAPTVRKARPSLFAGIKAWFSKLFASEPAEVAQPTRPKSNANRSGGGRRKSNRRQQQAKRAQRNENEHVDAPLAAAHVAEHNNGNQNGNRPSNRRRNNAHQVNGNRQNASEKAPVEKVQTDKPQAEVDNRRNNRSNAQENSRRQSQAKVRANREDGRHSGAAEQVVALATTAAMVENMPSESEAVRVDNVGERTETPHNEGKQRNNRRQNDRQRQQRERRHAGNKKRNIPSAAKIEHYLMIDEAALKVLQAVEHVLHPQTAELKIEEVVVNEPFTVVIPDVADYVGESSLQFAVTEQVAPEVEAGGLNAAEDDNALVQQSAERVRQAVAAVVESVAVVDSAEEEVVPAKNEQPSENLVEAVEVVEIAAETEQPTPLDLGGLILVETRADAMQKQPVEPVAPVRLRRADLPQVAQNDVAAPTLIQVETIRS